MSLIDHLRRQLRGEPEDPMQDALATLVVAAREDEAFRQRVLWVLSLPADQREPLVRSAVAEMALRGEPGPIRAAFLSLATEAGAQQAARAIRDGET